MVLFFFGYESLLKGYNVLNEFMFQSHMRFCRMQWSSTRFYGSLSVYSRPLPSEKIAPLQSVLPSQSFVTLMHFPPSHLTSPLGHFTV